MKSLQESTEESWNLTSNWQMKTVEFKPKDPKSLTLLLHGYNERGLRIFRKLRRYLPEDTYVIAPDAPFPLPRVKPDRVDFGYAWYFYEQRPRERQSHSRSIAYSSHEASCRIPILKREMIAIVQEAMAIFQVCVSIGLSRSGLCQVKSSLYINNRQPYVSVSNVLRKPAGEDGSGRRWRRGIDLT